MEIRSHEPTFIDLEKLPPRQKIIQVTIGLIAKEGIHGLTTRSIATAADVNIAAVNYYFGSKEKLIEESLQTALKHMFIDTDSFFQSLDRKMVLKKIMLYFLEGSLQHQGIIKAVFHEPINNNNYDTSIMQQIIHFIRDIISNMAQCTDAKPDLVKIEILQMISAAMMPALLPGLYSAILGEDFQTDPDIQNKYLEHFFK